MRALRKLAATDERLELLEVEEPEPGPGWVVLEVTYAGICGTDLHIAHNSFPSWPPVTLGHEFTGRVAALGTGVDGWSVGDRVSCEPHSLACGTCHLCRRGHAELCGRKRSPGWGIDGGMATRVVVPAHLLHRVPDTVSDLAAALCEPTAIVVTALERMPVEPGATVLVFGPGTVGLLGAMVARACGAGRTVVVGRASSRARLDLARRLGLEVWDSGQVDVAGQARRVSGGRGVDLVLESSGSAGAVAAGIDALRRRGRLCVLGMSGRPSIEVPWDLAMHRALDVAFSLSSSWSSWDGALALMARGAVDPAPLATVFPLADWPAAFAALTERTVVKALLDPRPDPAEVAATQGAAP
jgi:L-iditol 2-dehydrogenase